MKKRTLPILMCLGEYAKGGLKEKGESGNVRTLRGAGHKGSFFNPPISLILRKTKKEREDLGVKGESVVGQRQRGSLHWSNLLRKAS